ncbi:MAG: hypothetical protein IJH91_09540 [Mogibacterium sp.]|nr:hypothetical protein [Mogibacterium sp.]
MKRTSFKKWAIIAMAVLMAFALAGCGSGQSSGDGEEKKPDIEILDSGVSANENGDYTYAVVFRNNTEKAIKIAYFDVTAYDGDGKKLKAQDDWYTMVRVENVRPGATAACTVMRKQEWVEDYGGIMPFSEVPADVQFKRSISTSFRKADSKDISLRVVDFELVDGEHIPWVGTGEENGPVYDGDDDIFFIATVANDGEEDFFYDPTADECTIYACGHVVYKDETGKVIGGADLFMGGLNAQDPRVEIKAGGEAEVLFEGIHCYWPSESQELYVEAVDYE